MQPHELVDLGQQLRVDSIRAVAAAGSGHATSCMSAADVVAVLAGNHLRYDFDRPRLANNDRLIFSKGHAAPLLYALYKAVGAISDQELLSYRRFGSRLEGHPTPRLPWVPVATGSLGQGLPFAVGAALAGHSLDRLPYRVWVLCGDSEMSEGSVWEAFEQAGHRQLANLVTVLDLNRLGQGGPTLHQWDADVFTTRARAFGWCASAVDGHDVVALDHAFAQACAADRPSLIVAVTRKGSGVPAVEDQEGWHGKPLPDPGAAIAGLGGVRNTVIEVALPADVKPHPTVPAPLCRPSYPPGDHVATRAAFGAALAALGTSNPRVVAVDAEVSHATHLAEFWRAHPDRMFDMCTAEQQMVATALGVESCGWVTFAATFAAFLGRAMDFIRMAAISQANLRLCGSHGGVSIGGDGPSQMGLEDLAWFRSVHGSTVLYPCDANQTVRLVELMAETSGISYLRTTRGATPVIYPPEEIFEVGGSKVVRASDADLVTVIGAGITVHEALDAADRLAGEIPLRVIDAYSVKPLDIATIRSAVAATHGRLVVVEDHRPEGGLGEAVAHTVTQNGAAVRMIHLAVNGMPGSGTAEELRGEAGIDVEAIVTAARALAPTPVLTC